ncbi:MAG: hypothetical protein U5L95_00210 [Candidatus Saccharibacteria bacterium]|nr:hypothetical protein [Candidatus Saccharibacteria bacterium]
MAKRKKRPYHYRHSRPARWWREFGFKHTLLSLIIVGLFILLLDTALIQGLLLTIKETGLLGIFLLGILFVSFFTAAPATLLLISLAGDYNLVLMAMVAGAGTIIGDWIILQFFEEKVGYELKPLVKKYGITPIIRQMRTKKFRPIAVLVGMFFLASPLPDEAGLGLLGLTKTPIRKLLPIIFVINSTGIFILLAAARAATT